MTAVSLSLILTALASAVFISFSGLGFQVVASFLRGAAFPMWAYIGVLAGSLLLSRRRLNGYPWFRPQQEWLVSCAFVGGCFMRCLTRRLSSCDRGYLVLSVWLALGFQEQAEVFSLDCLVVC